MTTDGSGLADGSELMNNINGDQAEQTEGRRAFLTRMAAVTGALAVPAIVSFGAQQAAAAPASKGVPASEMGGSGNMGDGCPQAAMEVARLQGVIAKVDVQLAALNAKILERQRAEQSTRSYVARRDALQRFRSTSMSRLAVAQEQQAIGC